MDNSQSNPKPDILVLLADDSLINQEVAIKILKKNGFLVEAASDGIEAIKLLGAKKFDIVLMDVQMPEMDGLQATRLIRDQGTSVSDHDIPIIAMTANATPKDQEACRLAGMDDYISKPFDPGQLIAKMRYWIDKKKSSQTSNLQPGSVGGKNSPNIGMDDHLSQPVMANSLQTGQDISPDSVSVAIQFEKLFRRLSDDQDLALNLLKKLDIRLEKELAEMNVAIQSGDFVQVRTLAHKLKGSAANLSADPLSAVLEVMEKVATENNRDLIMRQKDVIQFEAKCFHLALQTIEKKS